MLGIPIHTSRLGPRSPTLQQHRQAAPTSAQWSRITAWGRSCRFCRGRTARVRRPWAQSLEASLARAVEAQGAKPPLLAGLWSLSCLAAGYLSRNHFELCQVTGEACNARPAGRGPKPAPAWLPSLVSPWARLQQEKAKDHAAQQQVLRATLAQHHGRPAWAPQRLSAMLTGMRESLNGRKRRGAVGLDRQWQKLLHQRLYCIL